MSTHKRCISRLILTLAWLLLLPCLCLSAEIVLLNKFIDTYYKRATIVLDDFLVNIAHDAPNPAKEDGDFHIAGRSTVVGLSMVAEIMNAASEQPAIDLVHALEGKDKPVRLAGVWRLWCEHPKKKARYTQGSEVPKYDDSNPDHVFEVHPVTEIGDIKMQHSFRPISGYEKVLRKADRTRTAFNQWNDKSCEIRRGQDTTTLVTTKADYNYVEFLMKVTTAPENLDDGHVAVASVFARGESKTEPLAHDVRMIFVEGTPPARKIKNLKAGSWLHVLGIPRISLHEVKELLAESKEDTLRVALPYEIVIAGVFPDNGDDEDKEQARVLFPFVETPRLFAHVQGVVLFAKPRSTR